MLSISIEDIQLDLELDLFLRNEELKSCDECGNQTFREFCPICPGLRKVRSEVDRLAEREARGEEITFEQYEAALYGDQVSREN